MHEVMHFLWILFGPGTWGAGGNMVAWVICGVLAFGWQHARDQARHAELLKQNERHHRQMKEHISQHFTEGSR